MVHIRFGPWRFPLLNLGQLVSLEILMVIDPLLWMDLDRRWKNFARLLDLLLQNGIPSCYAQVLPVKTADLGMPNPETRNIANIRPPPGLAKFHFPYAFDPEMAFQLRERNTASLEEM
jgi:hypothetical protein